MTCPHEWQEAAGGIQGTLTYERCWKCGWQRVTDEREEEPYRVQIIPPDGGTCDKEMPA